VDEIVKYRKSNTSIINDNMHYVLSVKCDNVFVF